MTCGAQCVDLFTDPNNCGSCDFFVCVSLNPIAHMRDTNSWIIYSAPQAAVPTAPARLALLHQYLPNQRQLQSLHHLLLRHQVLFVVYKRVNSVTRVSRGTKHSAVIAALFVPIIYVSRNVKTSVSIASISPTSVRLSVVLKTLLERRQGLEIRTKEV